MQIMRLDFVQRRRQWESELARDAPLLPSDPLEPDEDREEEDAELPTWSNMMQISTQSTQQKLPEEEVEEVLQQEDAELEALLSYMPAREEGGDRQSDHLYSDDDDYDALFSEFIEREDTVMTGGGSQNQPPVASQGGEAMDMS